MIIKNEFMKNTYLVLILFLALFLRLVHLDQSFWLDEAAQVIESARPFSQQLQIAADFHPPGFHLLLHFWMFFGHSEVWIRLLPVLFSLGSITVVYAIGKRIADEKTGLIAALFLALNPYHLWYSQEARPYMMLVFFVSLSVYALITRRWKLYTLSLIGSWYSTYFAPFVFLGQGIYILVFQRSRMREFCFCQGIAFLVFVSWIPSFLQQLRIGTGGVFAGWTNVVSVQPTKAAVLTFAKFFLGRGSIENNYLYALSIFPATSIFFLLCWRMRKTKEGKWLMILFFVPFFAALLVSFVVPVVAPQRLTFLLPIMVLIFALGMRNVSKHMQAGILAVIIITSAIGVFQYYLDPRVQREQWREAVQSIESEAPPSSVAIFAFPDPFAPYLWYQNGRVPGIGIAPLFAVRGIDLAHLGMDTPPHVSRVYLFQYLMGLTDPNNDTVQYLLERGFQQIEQKNFEGVGFIYVFERL